jgi:hypothetical protein
MALEQGFPIAKISIYWAAVEEQLGVADSRGRRIKIKRLERCVSRILEAGRLWSRRRYPHTCHAVARYIASCRDNLQSSPREHPLWLPRGLEDSVPSFDLVANTILFQHHWFTPLVGCISSLLEPPLRTANVADISGLAGLEFCALIAGSLDIVLMLESRKMFIGGLNWETTDGT